MKQVENIDYQPTQPSTFAIRTILRTAKNCKRAYLFANAFFANPKNKIGAVQA